MMQECPRCGFSQPKDRFCANCGLDIENFHPAPVPLWKQITSNTMFQVASVIFSIAVMVGIIYWKQADEIKRIAQETFQSTPKATPSEKREAELQAKPNQKEKAQEVVKKEKSEETLLSATETEAHKPKPEDPIKKEPVLKKPTSLYIQFAEISLETIQKIQSSGQIVGGDGAATAIAINWDKDLKAWQDAQAGQSLPGQRRFTLKEQDPISLTFIRHDAEETSPEGVSFYFRYDMFISSLLESGVEIDLEVKTHLPAPIDLEQTASFSARINPGTIVIILGSVPPLGGNVQPPENIGGSPLEVYYSADFASQNSDFAILLQFK